MQTWLNQSPSTFLQERKDFDKGGCEGRCGRCHQGRGGESTRGQGTGLGLAALLAPAASLQEKRSYTTRKDCSECSPRFVHPAGRRDAPTPIRSLEYAAPNETLAKRSLRLCYGSQGLFNGTWRCSAAPFWLETAGLETIFFPNAKKPNRFSC